MTNITPLKAAEKPIDPDLIEMLEDTLTEAKRGDVTGVLLLSQDAAGVSYKCAGLSDRFKIIGFLHHAMVKLTVIE